MPELDSIFLAPPTPQNAAPAPARSPTGSALSFGDVLSALNPLQYIPVVGTLYRAATGDTVPDGTRMVGGMVLSTLMGGPIGLVTNVATTLFEKATGIDPERIGRTVLAGLGLGSTPEAPPADAPVAVAQAAPPAAPVPDTPVPDAGVPLSPAQLTAYGVAPSRADGHPPGRGEDAAPWRTSDIALPRGTATTADQLNAIELTRLDVAPTLVAAAYSRAGRPA